MFSKNVERLRERLGMSQKELGEMVGVSQGMISHIEKGLKNPSLGLAFRIATALHTTVDAMQSDHLFDDDGA
ncbi:MAG: helix-turn-helix transcriptional regulator [Christensenellales bacterium]|jgi:putative transcriptional regulator